MNNDLEKKLHLKRRIYEFILEHILRC